MPSEKLIEFLPGKGLDSGVFPSSEHASGDIWQTGLNMWFRERTLEHLLGRQKILPLIARASQSMAQALTQAKAKRLYWEDFGTINYWEGMGAVTIGGLDPGGDFDMETWGDWLIATDNINPLQIWQNTGALATIPDALTQFSKVKIVRRLAVHLIAYNTDVLPEGLHWCSANDPLTWTPSLNNSARNLPIRDLDSEIIAVEDLGAQNAVYSKNSMLLIQYVGPTQWFGVPAQALSGIGAVSKHSVVSLGNYNFGLCRAGIFVTDGNTFNYIDRPAVDRWLQENVDWTKASSIVGYWDARLSLVVWSVPLLIGGRTAVGMDPKMRLLAPNSLYATGASPLFQKTWTYVDGSFTAALPEDVFDQPILALPDGIHFTSISGTNIGNFTAQSFLQDGGSREHYKSWDYAVVHGAIDPSSQVRFGFADDPEDDAIEWSPWGNIIEPRIPFGPRESVYMAIAFKSNAKFRLSGLTVYGEKAGNIN
jgi:hypothetical protein